jgi:hypothetical protein
MPGIVCFIPLEKGIGVEDPVLLPRLSFEIQLMR